MQEFAGTTFARGDSTKSCKTRLTQLRMPLYVT